MGRGTARQAAQLYPDLPLRLGDQIRAMGNHVCYFSDVGAGLFTFPVKHRWFEDADLGLISRSLSELVIAVNKWVTQMVYLPRPGCGNGGRNWWSEVRPLLVDQLDDRFTVVDL